MTRSYLLLAVAAAVLALPLAATAADSDPAFDAFRAICGDTNDNFPTVVTAAATADGWQDANVMGDDFPGVSVTDKAARAKGEGTQMITLRATRGLRTAKEGDITVSTCVISSANVTPGLLGRVQAWLKLTPASTDSDKDTGVDKASYLLTLDADGARQAITQADVAAAVGKGGAHLLKFREGADGEVLEYDRFSK